MINPAQFILPYEPDPRANAYPLIKSYTPTVLISLAYVFISYAWRSSLLRIMKERPDASVAVKKKGKPSDNSRDFVKWLMVLYNMIMVFYSAYISVKLMWAVRDIGYGLGCVEKPDPNDRSTDILIQIGYLFYFSKFIEMLDTVFFLWRGKVDQVSFLHVFHHASMPPTIWWGLKYAPGGLVFTFPLANCFVHVLMYTYYGLAAAGLYKYLWWKKYLTIAQMAQFVFLIVHQGQVFYRSTPCNYPKIFPAAVVFYSSLFFVLFANFYINAYWRKKRLAKCDAVATDGLKKHKEHDVVANGDVLVNGSISSNGHLGSSKSGDLRERKRRT